MEHIFFILDYYLPHRWWVENVFENIITRLLQKWYKITVLTSRFDSNLKKIESEKNLDIYRIWRSRTSFMFFWFFKGIKILSQEKDINLIHTSTYGWAIPASILWKIFHKKVILTVHEIFWNLRYRYKWKIWWFIYKLFEKFIFAFPYDIYHCVSRYTMNSIRLYYWVSDQKIRMIYNGIDTAFRNPKKVSEKEIYNWKKKNWWWNSKIILYYWHAGISKWIDYLVESLPNILKENPEVMVVLNIINSKREENIKDSIYSKIHSSEYKNRVQVCDWYEKEDLRILLAASDIVVAPSLSEWFGSVHSEVCQMWKILLTTNISSIPEVVFGRVKFIDPSSPQEITRWIKNVLHWVYEEIPSKIFSRDDSVEELESIYKTSWI